MDNYAVKNIFESKLTQEEKEKKAAKIIYQIVEAINLLHQMNIIHRDLSGKNIIFCDSSPDSNLKLIDFGISTYITNCKDCNKQVGTCRYMAPEMIGCGDLENVHYGKEIDLWALGMNSLWLLTEKRAITGKSIENCEINKICDFKLEEYVEDKHLSSNAIDFLQKTLEIEPSKRADAETLLHHKWFKDLGISDNKETLKSQVDTSQIKEELKQIYAEKPQSSIYNNNIK